MVGGSEEYTTRALRALAVDAPSDLHITLFTLAPFAAAHPDLVAEYPTVTVDLDGRSRARRILAEATWLPHQGRRRGIDVLHHAGGVIPPGPAVSRFSAALTIHDLQPLVLPENFSMLKRRWLAAMIPRSAAKAEVVLTPSDPASASVVRRLGVASGRVLTVPTGSNHRRRCPSAARTRCAGATTCGAPSSSTRPSPTPTRSTPPSCAPSPGSPAATATPRSSCPATRGPPKPTLAAVIRGVRCRGRRVRRTGRIGWDDLHALYAVASVVAVPSRFEGFGAPALEAMAAGVAVMAADATALPWVLGDAGVLVPGRRRRPPGPRRSTRLLGDPCRAGAGGPPPGAPGRPRSAGRAPRHALAAGYRQAGGMGEDGSRPP